MLRDNVAFKPPIPPGDFEPQKINNSQTFPSNYNSFIPQIEVLNSTISVYDSFPGSTLLYSVPVGHTFLCYGLVVCASDVSQAQEGPVRILIQDASNHLIYDLFEGKFPHQTVSQFGVMNENVSFNPPFKIVETQYIVSITGNCNLSVTIRGILLKNS
jgi:hypothetical protein